jgi:Tol biopolymer transport system component
VARLALVIVAAIALAFASGTQAPNTSGAATRDVRLTIGEGTSMAAAVSPDGQTIVIDLLGALWTLDIDGGRATRILDDGYDAHAPSWSPDGRRIAFQAYRENSWNIWTVGRDGSDLRRETSSAFDDREPHWSPDGTRLAFASDRSGNYDVWTIALAERTLQQITHEDGNEFMPAWSADGQDVIYLSDRPKRGVYATRLATMAERLLHADSRTLAGPTLSGDGRLAYVAIDGATAHLIVASDNHAANIAASDEDVFPFRPSWTRNGDLVYTADGAIKKRTAGGGSAQRIDFTADVSFTRDGFRPERRALPDPGPQPALGLMRPAIAPDGSRIAFAALGDLWLVPAQQGTVTPTRLTNDVFIETDPAWSPDGTQLAFSSDRAGSMDLWIRTLENGDDRRVATRATSAAWSPDGSRIAFLDPESRLQILDVATGAVRQAHGRLNEPSRPSWLPGGRAVVMGALKPYSTRLSRRYEPGADGSSGRAHAETCRQPAVERNVVQPDPAHVNRHARRFRASLVARRQTPRGHRRRQVDGAPDFTRRGAARQATDPDHRDREHAVVDSRFSPVALSICRRVRADQSR